MRYSLLRQIAVFTTFLAAPSAVLAQEELKIEADPAIESSKPLLASMKAGRTCLRRSVESARSDGAKNDIVIAVPQEKAADFVGRGFTRTSCGSKVDQTETASICALARSHDPRVNLSFWSKFTLTVQERCSVAEVSVP